MITINTDQELHFIHSEKVQTSDKEGMSFQLLNIAVVLITNYINANTARTKKFYKMIYLKTKKFYLEYRKV